MKFSELSDKDKVIHIRNEFNGLVESFFINRNLYKDKFSEEEHATMNKFMDSIKDPECDPECGECFLTSAIEEKIPPELRPLARLAKTNCESRGY